MMRAFPDKHSHAFPLEGEGLAHTSSVVQTTPQSTLPYLEQNPPFSSSIYDPYMQSPWTLDGFSLSTPVKSPQIGMDFTIGWVRDNSSPAGAENTINTSCMEFEHSGSNSHQQGQSSTLVGVPLKDATCEASPSGDHTSRRRRSKPNIK